MNNLRKINKIITAKPVMEGAGVHLKRVFGYHEMPELDPFLLLDHFGSDKPEDYMAGFPWHPHRGIETVTYMIEGEVEHGDSIGNSGLITSGDIQWMTAGSGIIHQEMPRKYDGTMRGFQLWVNLPKSHKMMDPRYRDIKADEIPLLKLENGVKINLVCGEFGGVTGPAQDIVVDNTYMDVTVPADTNFRIETTPGYKTFAYVFEGAGRFDADDGNLIRPGNLVQYSDGDWVHVSTADFPVRFLLVSGQPLNEPIAWKGPIVMNTNDELATAFREYREGTFIKTGEYPVQDDNNIPYKQ